MTINPAQTTNRTDALPRKIRHTVCNNILLLIFWNFTLPIYAKNQNRTQFYSQNIIQGPLPVMHKFWSSKSMLEQQNKLSHLLIVVDRLKPVTFSANTSISILNFFSLDFSCLFLTIKPYLNFFLVGNYLTSSCFLVNFTDIAWWDENDRCQYCWVVLASCIWSIILFVCNFFKEIHVDTSASFAMYSFFSSHP